MTFKDKRNGWKAPTAYVTAGGQEHLIKDYVKVFYKGVFMSGKALNKQEMDSIDLAKFVFAFAVIHIHAGGGRSYIRF